METTQPRPHTQTHEHATKPSKDTAYFWANIKLCQYTIIMHIITVMQRMSTAFPDPHTGCSGVSVISRQLMIEQNVHVINLLTVDWVRAGSMRERRASRTNNQNIP